MNLTPKNTEKDEEREGGRQEGRQKAAVINRRLTKQRVQTIPGWLLTDSLCNSLNRDDGLQRAQSSCPYALAEPASCLTNCLVSEHKAQPSRSRRWETWVPWTVAPGKTIFLITEQLSIISGDGGETYMSSSKEGTCQPFFIFQSLCLGFFLIEVRLICNAVLVLGIQQSNSVGHIHSFPGSFSSHVISRYWISFPVL